MKNRVLKVLGECLLIVFSVMLAFYLEEVRQRANQKQLLISKLEELRISLVKDSLEFENKIRFLEKVNDSIYSQLRRIASRESATSILAGFGSTRFYYSLRNWALERILVDGSMSELSYELKTVIQEYSNHRDFAANAATAKDTRLGTRPYYILRPCEVFS